MFGRWIYPEFSVAWLIPVVGFDSVQCTVYSVQCKVYSVQCTVYTVQCTVYRTNPCRVSQGSGVSWREQTNRSVSYPLSLEGFYTRNKCSTFSLNWLLVFWCHSHPIYLWGTALCPLHPEYSTPYPRWLRKIIGMNHPKWLHAVSET